eukprot:2530047-Rhodomonas_salina.2
MMYASPQEPYTVPMNMYGQGYHDPMSPMTPPTPQYSMYNGMQLQVPGSQGYPVFMPAPTPMANQDPPTAPPTPQNNQSSRAYLDAPTKAQISEIKEAPTSEGTGCSTGLTLAGFLHLSVYMVVGILGYKYGEEYEDGENWTFIDGFYFTMMTMSTVGYGDIR